ncbi:hypothetical protein [Indioceanicola profundi]|uniref:hypothetical protein n=1 Tax=Indioceanicola profundi TaxID=2220096 RepID=UPI0013C434DF|nr:hypothetical protein [Indioceanicola profundi]
MLRDKAVRAVAAYVGRFDRRQDAEAEDESGAAQYAADLASPGEEVFGKLRDETGEEITPAEFVARFSEPGYFGLEARHIVFAVPGTAVQADVLAHAWLADTALNLGVPAAWAVHTDHTEHPHVHVVLGARLPGTGQPGPMLPFAPDGRLADGLRAVLVRHAREMGLDVSAERESDRPDWSADPPPRKVALLGEGRAGSREVIEAEDPFALRLRRSAPAWYARWGAVSLERAGLVQQSGELDPDDMSDPFAAASYRMLAAESKSLARWMAANRPDVLRAADLIGQEAPTDDREAKRRQRWHRRAFKERLNLAKAIRAWDVGLDADMLGRAVPASELERLVLTSGPIGGAIRAIVTKDPAWILGEQAPPDSPPAARPLGRRSGIKPGRGQQER